jgi:hypothetical protein
MLVRNPRHDKGEKTMTPIDGINPMLGEFEDLIMEGKYESAGILLGMFVREVQPEMSDEEADILVEALQGEIC